jgi:hypothetical protein
MQGKDMIVGIIDQVSHIVRRKAGPEDYINDYTEYSVTMTSQDELHTQFRIPGKPTFAYGQKVIIEMRSAN